MTGHWVLENRTGLETGTDKWAGWRLANWGGSEQILDLTWAGLTDWVELAPCQTVNTHTPSPSLSRSHSTQSASLPQSTVDATGKDTYTHSTPRYVPWRVPTSPSLSQSRSKSQSKSKSKTTPVTKALGPPSLNTDLHLFRPCWLFFRLAQWFLLFLPPYPPFPSHTPAHFFSTSTTTNLSYYSFSLLLPYPSPNLVFVATGFSSSSPLSLFGHVLLSSSPSPSSFSSRTATHHLGLLLRTSPFRVSADPQT